MRKLIVLGLMAAAAIPSIASAQSGELRHDRRDIREEQRDVNRAIRNGASPGEIRAQRQDVREARREYRQDWRDHRRDNRNDYRRSAYVGPRGYVYRPVSVGYRFQPEYYSSRYYVTDYGRYRLAAPGRFQRWVRYGNDVALVNTRTGRVVAVNRGFFW